MAAVDAAFFADDIPGTSAGSATGTSFLSRTSRLSSWVWCTTS